MERSVKKNSGGTAERGAGQNPPPYFPPQEMETLLTVRYKGDKEVDFIGGNKSFNISESKPIPIDRFYAVYIILMLHGVGTLMPWNMFITANDYFVNYKLAEPVDIHASAVNSSCHTSPERTMYQRYFLGVLGFVAQVPNVLLNAMNLFCQMKGGSSGARIVWSIIVVTVMFILTIVLAMIDSSTWPSWFFWITMGTVVVINMANGVYQNSVFGTAACLPMKYTNAVILGSNISGTLTSVIAIISIWIAPDRRTSAIYYFLAAIFVLLIAFDTYFALQILPFYRHYAEAAKRDQKADTANTRPPYLAIFKKCWIHDLGVFLVFFVTLSVFPAIQANVKRSDPDFFVSEKYYAPIFCFLFFNVFAVCGNIISSFIQKPGPRWVILPVILRLLFIPFFMLCNFNPTARSLPILISNDYVYIAGGILMAITSGYFSSLTMMYAPRNVEPKYQGIAGMMAAFFLILGIATGITFSIPLIAFIERVGSGVVPIINLNATALHNCTTR